MHRYGSTVTLLLAPVITGAIYTSIFLLAWVQLDERAIEYEDEEAATVALWCKDALPSGIKVTVIAGLLYGLSLLL